MYEGLWTACLEEYCKTLPPVEGTRMEVDRHADRVFEWMEARAKEHKAFCLWKQFLLHDYPAYLTFRVALRTGDFMLRLDALRRIAPIFFIVGKDRYQVLLIDHLMEMARMSKSDLKVMSELFSVNLGKDAYARIGLDERQEVANRLFKTLTKRILSSSLEKMAPRAQLREEAILQYEEKFIERPATERDRCRELVGKREPVVETAISCLRKCPLFDGDAGKDKVVALDGRVITQPSCAEILGAPDQALEKMRDVAAFRVLNDKTKKGATRQKVYYIPSKNITTKATNKTGRASALKDSVANARMGGGDFKPFLLNVWDLVSATGSLEPGQVLGMMSAIGTTTPYCMANASGGAKHANKAQGPMKWLEDHLQDGFAYYQFYQPDAHGVDLPVSIHQGVRPLDLEEGSVGVIAYFVRELYSKWLMETELLLLSYDRAVLVPVIKEHEQAGRTEKI
ncbi:unnamed protein product, partial [Pylaiella littoralis]